jgi:hypothetical protein
MYALTKLRAVWANACTVHILQKGYPFPFQILDTMSDTELEYHTCRAYSLATRWLAGTIAPRRTLSLEATASTSVQEVRFIPGHAGEWILTISKGIWDILTIWDLGVESGRKVCEWSPRGVLLSGVCVNLDGDTDAIVGVSVFQNELVFFKGRYNFF